MYDRDRHWIAENERRMLAHLKPSEPKPAPVITTPYVSPNTPHVYFIQDGDAIKIGAGQNPLIRRNTLQTGNPRELILIGFYEGVDEKILHSHFRAFHIRGEWFRDNPALRELISARCHANDNRPLPAQKAA